MTKVNFNSIKVQLELVLLITLFVNLSNFNSIKVQLELSNDRSDTVRYLFQFHKGTIRTQSRCNRVNDTPISIP